MASHQPSGGASFSLFPNPNTSKPRPVTRSNNHTPRSRRSESRERRVPTPQQHQERHAPAPYTSSPNIDSSPSCSSSPPAPLSSPPQDGRQTPQQGAFTLLQFEPPHRDAPDQASADGTQPVMTPEEQQDALGLGYGHVPVQQPRLTIEIPGRTETAFSQAQTLVHSNSGRSRSSIAKYPLPDGPYAGQQPQSLRSMFPTYNPDLSLDQQNYGPTQLSPSRVPRAIISRQSYYEDVDNAPERPAIRSPGYRVPNRSHNPPAIPKTCTTDQLRDLWKVTNGWRAPGSEGRVYCLKLTRQSDAPVYTLSSASQPFYNLRLDPTSASAYVSLTRHDPSKAYKVPKAGSHSSTTGSILNGAIGGSARGSESKYWQEALSTTLEEESRKHLPNDGLVALLMPHTATRIAVERSDDPLSVAAAEREYARLVWDDDSASHYLVHPALATPFCVTVENCPAWSRVEYTLEHHESPQHLAKLTRDGTGAGWLEIDTSIASKIESFYIVDVAVAALLLVAAADDRKSPAAVAEMFEAPPMPEPPKQARSSLSSALSRHRDDDEGKKKSKKKKDNKRPRMEQFEIDLESQNESLSKNSKKSDEKRPFGLRVVIKLAEALFKGFVGLLTIVFTCFMGVVKVFYRCVGSKY